MGEIIADTRYGPADVPADAYLALTWSEGPPACWKLVGIATGYTSSEQVLDACGKQWPELDGRPVLASKIGGSSSMRRKLKRTTNQSVSVELLEIRKWPL